MLKRQQCIFIKSLKKVKKKKQTLISSKPIYIYLFSRVHFWFIFKDENIIHINERSLEKRMLFRGLCVRYTSDITSNPYPCVNTIKS